MLYLDSSGIVKLVLPEPETAALIRVLRSDPEVVSSAIAHAEVVRAARRIRMGRTIRRAETVLGRITMVRVHQDVLDKAADADPPELRTLDALHLATALLLQEDLKGFVSYDERLASAAEAAGLRVLAPA